MNFDWSKVTKAELKNVDEQGNPKKPITPGGYDVTITGITQRKFDSGAEALVIRYTIEHGAEKDRDINENFFLTKKDGTINSYAADKLKLRMLQAGLTSEQINNFKGPRDEKSIGDFKFMLDAALRIEVDHTEIKEGPNAGKTIANVVKVARRSSVQAA